MVGMGHIELRKGKTADAHQHFEAAVGLTKGKDIEIFNDIGRAIADPAVKDADFAYGIDKLNQATQVKKFNDADTYVITWAIYTVNRSMAATRLQSYQKALSIAPHAGKAKFKIGMIYLTQNNKEYFLPAFDEATTIDPAYTPAYYQLFYYWYFRDVNKAAGYLDKYIANADPGPETEYLKTDFLYASSKFADAKTKALGLISSYGDKVSPRMYKMVAYSCDTLGDNSCAQQYMALYFTKQDTADIVGPDYEELANIDMKSTDSLKQIQAYPNFQLAVNRDTLMENKVKYTEKAVALAKKTNNKPAAAQWAGIRYGLSKNPTNSDLYAWGDTQLPGRYV